MNQRLIGSIVLSLAVIIPVVLWSLGFITLASLQYAPDRIAVILQYLSRSIPSALKVYGLSAALILGPIAISTLLELAMRKKDDSRFTLITHVIVVIFSLIGINFALHGATALIIKRTIEPNIAGILLTPFLISALYAGIRIIWWEKPVAGQDSINRGIEVIFDERRSVRILSQKSKHAKADGIAIHSDVVLPLWQETKHTLLIAAPGAGKTQVIYPLIERIRARGDAMLVYDFKGDFSAAFGEDKGVIILSPFDARGYGWDIAADITTDLKALEFAACLMPDHNSREPFFKKAAQDLLAGVITRLIAEKGTGWNVSDLVGILAVKSEVVAACEKYRPAALSALGPVDEKQASGVFGELRTGSIQLEFLARAWPEGHKKIALTEWVRSEERREQVPVIMLRGHQQYRKLDGFLTVLVCSLLIKEALSLPDSYQRRIWAILDEFGNLPKIDGIDALLTGVRSKGVRIVAAIQDIAQIEETYSKSFSQTFFNCFGITMAGLCSGATARYLSDAFGKNKIDRVQRSKSRKKGGSGPYGGISVSETQQIVIENALIDTDFSNLTPPSLISPASFWLRISGWPIARLTFPVKPLPSKYAPHVEPKWINEPIIRQDLVSHEVDESDPEDVDNDEPTLVRDYQPFRRSPGVDSSVSGDPSTC